MEFLVRHMHFEDSGTYCFIEIFKGPMVRGSVGVNNGQCLRRLVVPGEEIRRTSKNVIIKIRRRGNWPLPLPQVFR